MNRINGYDSLHLSNSKEDLLSNSFTSSPGPVRDLIAKSGDFFSTSKQYVRLTQLDSARIKEHFNDQSEEDLRLRFSRAMTPSLIEKYVEAINFNRDIVIGVVDDGRIIGFCHMPVFHEKGHMVGELGVSLIPSARGKGIATQLIGVCFAQAALQKISRLYIFYKRENHSMAALCRKFGAKLDRDVDEVIATMEVLGQSEVGQVSERFARGRDIEVIEKKPAQPKGRVVLVHGAGGDAWQWRQNLVPYLASQNYHALAISLRNHGKSAKAPGTAIEDYVRDVEHVLQESDERTILVGHSMGGFIVQKVLERSRKISKAILLCSLPPSGLQDRQLIEAKHALKHNCGREVLDELMRGASPVRIQDICTPVIVIGGRHDRVIPMHLVHQTAMEFDTEAICMENSGHAVMLSEDWEKAAQTIIS